MTEIHTEPFPKFIPHRPEINTHLCYFIKPYPRSGYSISYTKVNDDIMIKVLDPDCMDIDVNDMPNDDKRHFDSIITDLLLICGALKIQNCQLFFARADKYRLVDVYNRGKFAGPGMINDIFKTFDKQEILEMEPYDPDKKYDKMYVKPSKFMTVKSENSIIPLYVRT
ncbi:MAG: hypothetical protein GF411_13875 [Candidatus Lokiarchaeota archaeon]|nr:hypothetical protein [Candidatus Lokiarchaeota archaeon]